MLNSTIAWADANCVFRTVGDGARFVNNLWHANGYALGDSATVSDTKSDGAP